MTDSPAEQPLPPLRERITFLTHRLNALMARACNPHFQMLKIDIITSRMLVVILEHGPLPAGEIVSMMALPQSTISHQLKRLEALHYVIRVQDKNDSRVRLVSLTDEGREVAREANRLSKQIVTILREAIGEEDIETFRRALKRADAALSEFEPSAD